jgi:hypothetical protein
MTNNHLITLWPFIQPQELVYRFVAFIQPTA